MTIKDIAKECGCAVGTVSRVLNNNNYVSDKTRKRVMEVVNKHGFVLNTNAKQLKQRESKTIIIIVKGISNIILNSLLEKVQKKMEGLPYLTKVSIIDEYENETQKAYQIYCEEKPLGFIFLGGNPERYEETFAKIQVPCVLISTKADSNDFQNLSSVYTDNFEASRFVAGRLAEAGHEKIGIIGGDIDSSKTSLRRYNGFVKGLEDNGIQFDFGTSYETTKYSFEGGYSAVERLLQKKNDLTAIYAMSDVMAIGACRKLRELGKSVPEDISIVGFDGLPIGQFYCPRLATVKQSEDELAEQGLQALLGCIVDKSRATQKVIPFEFICGESIRNIR